MKKSISAEKQAVIQVVKNDMLANSTKTNNTQSIASKE